MVTVHTEHLDDHTARLTVEVEPERIEKAMRQAARKLAKKARIPGFRPGKAPFKVVVRMFGHDYVLSEALDDIVDTLYKEALKTAEIEPYAPGTLEDVSEDGQRLVFLVPKKPETELGDYRSIRVEREVPEVTDEMVDEVVETMRHNHAEVQDVERPAELGDQVQFHLLEIVLEGEAQAEKAQDAEPEEAEEAEETPQDDHDHEASNVLFHEHDYTYILTDNPARESVPGLSEHLVGAKANDTLEFTLTLPEDYEVDGEDLSGRTVRVHAQVAGVQSRKLPELDNAFVQQLTEGKFETVEALRQDIRQYLEDLMQRQTDRAIFSEAVEKLVQDATFRYPPQAVEALIDEEIQALEESLQQRYGLSVENYLSVVGQTMEELRDQFREVATRRLQRSLALVAFARAEQLEVDDAAIEERIEEIVQQFSASNLDEKGLKALRKLVNTPQERANIAHDLLDKQITRQLVAIAKGEEPPLGGLPPQAEAEEQEEATDVAAEPTATPAEATEPTPPQAEADKSAEESE